jgi:hypothetical protein
MIKIQAIDLRVGDVTETGRVLAIERVEGYYPIKTIIGIPSGDNTELEFTLFSDDEVLSIFTPEDKYTSLN